MKYSIVLLALICSYFSQAQQTYVDREKTHLLGPIERQHLFEAPYDTLFTPSYDDYDLNDAYINKLNDSYLENVKIQVYIGTWCGDSHREIGRFYKLIDNTDINPDNIEIIALDNRREFYKQSPGKTEVKANIHRVPTFIFYTENQEIGRIVEYPSNSLEIDMAQIFEGIPSIPNYDVANEVGDLVLEESLVWDSLQLEDWEDRLSSEYELNTLGFVLLRRGDIENANKIFQINAELFPESGYIQTSLAYSYEQMGMVETAIDKYLNAYHLDNTSAVPARRLKEMIAMQKENAN